MYIYYIFIIYPSDDGHLFRFHLLGTVRRASINRKHKDPCARKGILGICLGLIQSGPTKAPVLHFTETSALISIDPVQVYTSPSTAQVLSSPHPRLHALPSVYLITAIMTGVRCSFKIILIHLLLKVKDAKLFLKYVLVVWNSSLRTLCVISGLI